MSSRLPRDPHVRTTKKASASAAAVQLLLRHGGRAAAKDESIEFFSALRLRECQTDPRVSGQTGIGPADRRGKTRRRSGGDSGLLSTETGKHDYDWLLTPPAATSGATAALNRLTRATSASYAKSNAPTPPAGTSGATAALHRLTRATSASYAKSNAPLSLARREKGNPTSRLARSSSAAHSSSVNTAAFASSCRPPHVVRTLSSASSSSINAASNACTTPLGSAKGSSPTVARQPRPPTTGASSPRSTGSVAPEAEQPALTTRRGAVNVARSRLTSQLSSAMSTAQPTQNVVRSSIIKQRQRPVPAAVKQCHGNGTAAMSSTAPTKSLLSSPFPRRSSAISASQSASRADDLLANERPSWSGRKIKVDKATAPRRTAGLASAATSRRLTSTSPRAVNEDLKPAVQQRSIHSSIASRSRLGLAATATATASVAGSGSIASGRRATSMKGKATVAARVDAFPSTRYDAMLLREDPRNLTWLNGCGDDDANEDGVGLVVEGSLELEPVNVTVTGTGTNGTAA